MNCTGTMVLEMMICGVLGCGALSDLYSESLSSFAGEGTCPVGDDRTLCAHCNGQCYYCYDGKQCSGDSCNGEGKCVSSSTGGGVSSGGSSSGASSSGGSSCFISCTGCYAGGYSIPSTNLNGIGCGQSCIDYVNTVCKGTISCTSIRYSCN